MPRRATHPLKPMLRSARQKALAAYLQICAKTLELESWQINFDPTLPINGCEAMVHIRENQHAAIQVSKAFWGWAPDYQRLVIAHELAHLVLKRLDDLYEPLAKAVDPRVFSAFMLIFEAGIEESTERFARMIAPRLPLPALS